MKRLAQEVDGLHMEQGGPILATQIENEYGNFSNDHAYMKAMYQIFLDAGFTQSLLYTVDPSKSLANGEIDGIYSGVNFGTGNAGPALDKLAAQRPGQPLFATEYWPGWFDLWGHPHETRRIEPQLRDIETILSRKASLNLYMVHGGTSFGMMAGASQSTGSYRGNVTSYDYDAPIDEAGHTTPKFFAYRDLILRHTGGISAACAPTPAGHCCSGVHAPLRDSPVGPPPRAHRLPAAAHHGAGRPELRLHPLPQADRPESRRLNPEAGRASGLRGNLPQRQTHRHHRPALPPRLDPTPQRRPQPARHPGRKHRPPQLHPRHAE
jgi:hypothetical protein